MPKTIYQSIINHIGEFAEDVLADGMLIAFKEGAPADLADYCFVHSHGELAQDLTNGLTLTLGGVSYVITAIGEVATINLRELGHITVRFDGATTAELPGCVHVEGEIPSGLKLGDMISISAK